MGQQKLVYVVLTCQDPERICEEAAGSEISGVSVVCCMVVVQTAMISRIMTHSGKEVSIDSYLCVCVLLVNFLLMASLGITSADTEELLEYIKEFLSCVRTQHSCPSLEHVSAYPHVQEANNRSCRSREIEEDEEEPAEEEQW